MLIHGRKNLLPYQYPQLLKFRDAVRHAYWLHTEFRYTDDIGDFRTNITSSERQVIKRAMLAISQVEVNVKSFWGELYKVFNHLEVQEVGTTFAESEVRHFNAYQFLLEKLGLQGLFNNIDDIPALRDRVAYLKEAMKHSKSGKIEDFILTLILFSLFIEHVSLFSQFLIIMSFNKHLSYFSGMSNVVEATSKEEQIHGEFGAALINILRVESPELFTAELEAKIYKACEKAYRAENKLLDWIFEEGELEFLPKVTVDSFIRDRFNKSLESIGLKGLFAPSQEELDKVEWFDVELKSKKEGDFFVKTAIDYSKKQQSITADDLF